MLVAVLREFIQQNADVKIVMVSRKPFAALFEGIPRLVFHGIEVEKYKGYLGLRKLAAELAGSYSPDYIADLHEVIRTRILNRVFRNRGFQIFQIDKGKAEKEHLTDIWNLEKHQLKRTVERYADVFRNMGFPLDLTYRLPENSIQREGVGFAPFAQHGGKMLPLDKSFEIARQLCGSAKLYLFGGGEQESGILQEWQQQLPNSESVAGKYTLQEELDLIARLRLMISMDSANMHLASLVGTRCISVWGSTHHFAGFLGYGQSEQDIVHVKDLTCRPCSVFGDKECYRGDYACLHEIDIQQIIQKTLPT